MSFLILFPVKKNDRRELSISTNAPKFPSISRACSVNTIIKISSLGAGIVDGHDFVSFWTCPNSNVCIGSVIVIHTISKYSQT